MAKGTCSINGCDGSRYGHGIWCPEHHKTYAQPEVRFWLYVDKSAACWRWTGGSNNTGYGYFWTGKRTVRAHRYAYELLVAAIPAGLHLDHMCHNKMCVKPAHLRLVTNKQNSENLQGATKTSTTGVRGVWPSPTPGKWCAAVGHHRRIYPVGTFDSIAAAEAAVIAKRLELFTHNDADRAEAS